MTLQKRTTKRQPHFFAVEGESEISFIKFINILADQQNLNIHLHKEKLNGGGYEKMLSEAVKKRGKYEQCKTSFLVVDSDRADRNEDSWNIEELTEECHKASFTLVIQRPNFEAVLARMFIGNEKKNFTSASHAQKALENKWTKYDKPEDAMALQKKFSISDLLRMATYDENLKLMLERLGFQVN